MVKKLRRRILVILTAILSLILICIQTRSYVDSYYYNLENSKAFLEQIAEQIREQEKFYLWAMPVYVFQVYEDGNIKLLQKGNDNSYEDFQLTEVAYEIAQQGNEEGVYHEFRYLLQEQLLVLLDETDIRLFQQEMLKDYCVSTLIGILFIFGCAVLISRWLTKPVEKAFEQQKQFLSDVSHELKTPLTVVGANAQKLQKEIGENKWLEYIVNENHRMGKLLNELLTLTRMESPIAETHGQKIDLSRAVTGILLPYESVAYEKGIHFSMDIEDGIFVWGEEEHLKQAVIILVDNAMHHVSKSGQIHVHMDSQRGKVEISVSNTGKEIPKEEQKKIFLRFYRGDKARNRKENRYGLGLAIAKTIVERHKGHIEVLCENGWTRFKIFLK